MSETYVKKVVCLANSRKLNGRCVAGKEIASNRVQGWVRPVSGRPSGELELTERWYGQMPEVAVGDIFLISLCGHKPHAYQPENELIDTKKYLGYQGKATMEQLGQCIDRFTGPLWINGPSTRYGVHDYILEAEAPSLGSSLKFIEVSDLSITVEEEWPGYGNPRSARGHFSINGHKYALKITDPLVEAEFLKQADGNYSVGHALLCVSLGEARDGQTYKLIASVIRKGFYGIV